MSPGRSGPFHLKLSRETIARDDELAAKWLRKFSPACDVEIGTGSSFQPLERRTKHEGRPNLSVRAASAVLRLLQNV